MNVSDEEARNSLEQAQAVSTRTRKTIAASYDSGILIMWGLICFTAFILTHFFLSWAWLIWMGLCGIGAVITLLVSWWQFHLGSPVRTPAAEKIGWRIFWFWTLLFAYMFIWLSILKPRHGIQINAFMITTIMFAYVVTGLWSKNYYMLWLGLIVTGFTLIGFYLIPSSWYCLWMAPTAGGALFVTGLYMWLCWR